MGSRRFNGVYVLSWIVMALPCHGAKTGPWAILVAFPRRNSAFLRFEAGRA